MARRRLRGRTPALTRLEAGPFAFGNLGTIGVDRPSTVDLATIRDDWESHRATNAPVTLWHWDELPGPERFAVRRSGEIVAMWGSKTAGTLELSSVPYYALHWLEVRGDIRGVGIGKVTMALVALRARELGADGVALHAVNEPDVLAFYRSLGAVDGVPRPWPSRRPLVGLHCPSAAIQRLAQAAEDAQEEANRA